MHEPQHPIFTPERRVIPIVILSVIFGLAAGAVGMLLAAAYVVPVQTPLAASLSSRGTLLPSAQEDIPSTDPARSAVLFFDRAPSRTDTFSTLVPSAAIGSGFVLTSDGWLLAHTDSFPKGRRPQDMIAVVGGKSFAISAASKDSFTGVLFLKIDASNLPVTAFGERDALTPGATAFAFDADGAAHRLVVGGTSNLPASTPADFVSSSERIQKVVRVSQADGLLPGSMLLSRQGEVVALLAGSSPASAYAIPFDSFSGVIGGVLHDRLAPRPLLGLRYVDLSRLIGVDAHGGRGALVSASADAKLPAVVRGAPAALAGITAGDIITQVNGEEITAKTALADVIAEYAPGSTVTLTVTGAKGERRVELTLGTATD